MAKTLYTTETYNDHTTFGGIISLSDFNTDNRGKNNTHGSPIARQIMSDKKFDRDCRKNAEARDRREKECLNQDI